MAGYRKNSIDRSETGSTTSKATSKSSNSKNGNGQHKQIGRRDRSNSNASYNGHHHHQHHHGPRKAQSKADLWKGSVSRDIGNSVVVQMVGNGSHTGYARVDPACNATPESLAVVPVIKVIEIMVDEERSLVAKDILEQHIHVDTADTFPSATELLELGAVWLLNETAYAKGENSHARRLALKDETDTPDWKDMTLRVHYNPDRFFVAHEVDWSKYCRGLLLDNGCTSAIIGGKKSVVPMTMLPDAKDGVIVYENNEVGFAVINKPGGMPCHSTISNHAEDVVDMFGAALKQRSGDDDHKPFLSVPLRVETEMHGLILAATKKEFCHYMTKRLETKAVAENGDDNHYGGVTKTYRCLVCIKDPNDIDRIEKMAGRTIEHYVDVRSPTPKKFVRNKPKSSNHQWEHCLMRILNVGQQSKNFRAACVSSKYNDSNDCTLAHRLWGPDKEHPAEDAGVQYVLQVDVQLMTRAPHQIRGQLAALGVPIVGDAPYGGGACEMKMHRHSWNRMALQICHLEFQLPAWEENEEKKKELVPSSVETKEERDANKCIFHLNTAWWSEYLVDYEREMAPGAVVQ